jgi:antirestriction protein ArdC
MPPSVHSEEARSSVYHTITQKIVAAIEAGAGEFVMPWHRLGPGIGRPTNAATGKPYRGVNAVALWAEASTGGYGSGRWATFQQWSGLGARVRGGEHGATIVVYKPAGQHEREEGDEDAPGAKLFARAFRVFNADQVDGWSEPAPPAREEVQVLDQVDAFVARTCAWIQHGGDVACYVPSLDEIRMPMPSRFVGSPTSGPTHAYYSTLLHELTHWSGATHRLNREFGKRFGDEAYAVEELVAELGAAFLCADLGITNEPRRDHAAYLSHWLTVLDRDPRAIFTAAKQAQNAAEYLASLEEPPF